MNTGPRVGVAVILYNQEGDILLGQRKGSSGVGKWSLPGGKIEDREMAEVRMSIELEEETSIVATPDLFEPRGWSQVSWMDDNAGDQNWVTLVYALRLPEGMTPKVTEPDKCVEWKWVDPAQLHSYDLFAPLIKYVTDYPPGGWAAPKLSTPAINIHGPVKNAY